MGSATITSDRRSLLHPRAALLTLSVDWLFFGAEFFSLETGVLVASLAAFVVTSIGVYWIQRRKGGDSILAAGLKALFAGIVAGVPTPIGGTVIGSLVLAMAGLRRLQRPRIGPPTS